MPLTAKHEWYADGLAFTCTQCGNCCTGPPGVVWFTDEEAEAIAGQLGITKLDLLQRYCKRVGARWSLREVRSEHGYDCVFLTRDAATGRAGCSIYQVRPHQCRTWPFWPENLRSRKSYEQAGRTCPGMQAGQHGEGRHYTLQQIRIIRDSHRD